MLKKNLVDSVASQTGLTKIAVREVFAAIAKSVRESILRGEGVMLFGLGQLYVRRRMPRVGRIIRTGETVPVPARNVVMFQPSTGLKKAANER